eukprot:TRINITY_DN3051_c0_g3_i2.p1 TRINITY_DN3051_c0_g3~~TRINITY_DN3051_c0_g3_i2.p1  ORF type:complete len:1708 (+),score=404.31 TRINITY_DN3051_c0_g3_i2:70-5193(+)
MIAMSRVHGSLSGQSDGPGRKNSNAPAFDPTRWADLRKQKIERAERLRAEQRARLQANGQLPLDGDSLSIPVPGGSGGGGSGGGYASQPPAANASRHATPTSHQPPIAPQAAARADATQMARQPAGAAGRISASTPAVGTQDSAVPERVSAAAGVQATSASSGPRVAPGSLAAPPPWATENSAAAARSEQQQAQRGRRSVAAAPPWATDSPTPEPLDEVPAVTPTAAASHSASLSSSKAFALEGAIRWPLEEAVVDPPTGPPPRRAPAPKSARTSPTSAGGAMPAHGANVTPTNSAGASPLAAMTPPAREMQFDTTPFRPASAATTGPASRLEEDAALAGHITPKAADNRPQSRTSARPPEDAAVAEVTMFAGGGPTTTDEITLPPGDAAQAAVIAMAAAAAVSANGDEATLMPAGGMELSTSGQGFSGGSRPGSRQTSAAAAATNNTERTDLTALFDNAYDNYSLTSSQVPTGRTRSDREEKTLDLRWSANPAQPPPTGSAAFGNQDRQDIPDSVVEQTARPTQQRSSVASAAPPAAASPSPIARVLGAMSPTHAAGGSSSRSAALANSLKASLKESLKEPAAPPTGADDEVTLFPRQAGGMSPCTSPTRTPPSGASTVRAMEKAMPRGRSPPLKKEAPPAAAFNNRDAKDVTLPSRGYSDSSPSASPQIRGPRNIAPPAAGRVNNSLEEWLAAPDDAEIPGPPAGERPASRMHDTPRDSRLPSAGGFGMAARESRSPTPAEDVRKSNQSKFEVLLPGESSVHSNAARPQQPQQLQQQLHQQQQQQQLPHDGDDDVEMPWWAADDGPSWMKKLEPTQSPQRGAAASSSSRADKSGGGFVNSSSALQSARSALSSASSRRMNPPPDAAESATTTASVHTEEADPTMWPQQPVAKIDLLEEALPPSDTFAPAAMRRNEAPQAPAAAASAGPEEENFVVEWMHNLRGAEEYVSDDPMVFGAPKPKAKPQAQKKPRQTSKPRSNSQPRLSAAAADAPSPAAAAANKNDVTRMLDMKRQQEDAAGAEVDLSFGKPKPRGSHKPLQQRSQQPGKQPRPPRPDSQSDLHGDPHHPAVGSNSRPSSGSGGGYFGSPQVVGGMNGYGPGKASAPGQIPERLRKSMDQRHEQRNEQRNEQKAAHRRQSRDERGKGGPPPDGEISHGSYPADEDGDSDAPAVRLPPLSADGGPRGRRCASVPPAEFHGRNHAQPAAERGRGKQAGGQGRGKPRPQSVSAAAADDDEKGGRQMFDKNTLRTMPANRDLFMRAVQQYRQSRAKGAEAPQSDPNAMLEVFVRKRPIFEKELHRADYDITTIRGSAEVVVHNCLFQADLKTPFVNHLSYKFDRVFDEKAENSDVYVEAAADLIRNSIAGGVGTMFMFGQTGSGKTHTMTAIQEMAARDLFEGADGQEPWLSVQFVELRGNRCFDLLAQSVGEGRRRSQPELKLREQNDGAYMADGAVDLFPKSPEELCTVLQMAQSRRFTMATAANDVSSRSHAICTIRIFQSDGQLLLVDCAGTERRKDSMYHSKERQQEGAEINASLHALKECIRYLTTQQRVPSHAYRASSLTKILADAFIRGPEARLAAICTVSPCVTDTEHTIATLRMGLALGGRGSEREEKEVLLEAMQAAKKPRLAHPKQWSCEQVAEWVRDLCGGKFCDVAEALPSNFTGQMLVRLTEGRCVQLCGGSDRRGRFFFDMLHQEIQRVDQSRKAG